MISGATLIDYRDRYSTSTYFKKRLERTVVPFTFWSIISVFYRYLISHWSHDSILDTISGIINTKYMAVYWFFIPLFAVYMSIPLLSSADKSNRIRIFKLISALTFIFTSILPTIFALVGIQYNSAIQIPVSGGYIIYVLLGYIIYNIDMKPKERLAIYTLGLLGWFIQFEGTNILSLNSGELTTTFKGYTNFPAVLQAVGIFVLFKYWRFKGHLKRLIENICSKLSKYTFGVYLIHFYLVDKVPGLINVDSSSIGWRTIGPIFIFAISVVLCYIASKIPIIRKTIGV